MRDKNNPARNPQHPAGPGTAATTPGPARPPGGRHRTGPGPLEQHHHRLRRPGPAAAPQPRRHDRDHRTIIDTAVTALHLPALLPGEQTPPPTGHPFEFRPVYHRRDGRPVPAHPEAGYLAEIAHLTDPRHRRLATTTLYDAGTPIRVSTVFAARDAAAADPDPHTPLLWQSTILLGTDTAAEWHYASPAAAAHGHATIVTALRAARAARRGPARRRAPSAAAPWRHGYHQRHR